MLAQRMCGVFAGGVLLFLLLSACSSSKSSSDADGDERGENPDTEPVGVVEEETVTSDEAEPVTDDVTVLPDADGDTYDPDCPPLLEAQFPYYREDGTIHFCRKCDTPTEKDPQCVQNLWKETNKKLTDAFPDLDCYPYPCPMEGLYPRTKEQFYTEEPLTSQYVPMHDCDLNLTNYGWDPGSSQIKHWNLSGGKIGFLMGERMEIDITQYSIADKFFLYDTSSLKYFAISPSEKGFVYQNGKALLYFRDSRSFELGFPYIYVGYFGTDGTYRVVFDKPIYSILYTPALNEKWAFANINFVKNGTSTMYYAKVGEWKWTALGQGVGGHPDLFGDLLGFYDDTANGYVCDLSKNPKSLEECMLVNRGNEEVRNIQFDRDHPGIFYYSSDFNRAITKVDMNSGRGGWVYEDVITDFSDATKGVAYSLVVEQVKNNVVMYLEIEDFGGSEGGGLACFYRIDTKKRYCMKKMENDPQYGEWVDFPYGHSEFEGKWFLYQKHANSPLILRDMDCYCEKEGVCPFEGLKK